MHRWTVCLAFVALLGCQPSEVASPRSHSVRPAAPAEADGAAPAAGTEEFEGIVELFGQPLRARRQVKLDDNGDYVKHGLAVAWYENGQKAGEMTFVDGKPHGAQLVWYETGKKKAKGEWENGLAVGQWTEWYDNGQTLSQGEMALGQRHGLWKFWNTDGTLRDEIEYHHGERLAQPGRSPARR
jgi:hypothetical protein